MNPFDPNKKSEALGERGRDAGISEGVLLVSRETLCCWLIKLMVVVALCISIVFGL